MRFAVFSRAVKHHTSGGLATAAWNICRCMADVGNHVSLYTTRTESFTGDVEEKGVHCKFLRDTTPLKYETYYEVSAAAFRDDHELKPFDAIVSISKAAKSVLTLPGRPPALFTSHGIGLDKGQDAINEAWVNGPSGGSEGVILDSYHSTYLRSANDIHCTEVDFHRKWDAVAGVSLSACMDFQTRLACPRVFFLPNPIYDVAWAAPAVERKAGDPLRVALAAGNLSASNKGIRAGLKLLADAGRFASAPYAEVHLFGGHGEAVRRGVTDLKIVDHGFLNQQEFIAELVKMDVLFDPSLHHSGCNTTVGQAMASGVPVIAFPFGGSSTSVRPAQQSGFLVAPGDGNAMANALRKISQNREIYACGARMVAHRLFHPHVAGERYTYALMAMRSAGGEGIDNWMREV